ncbi:MAG: acyl-CoA thioesterase [Pseudomonadota bacterium]
MATTSATSRRAARGLGDAYGLGFRELLAAGLVAPVVHASCDYLLPARFGDELVVVARLHASPRATVELTYEVRREADGALLARGRTVQVFTDPEGHLHLNQPDLLRRFWEQWGDQVREG